ncbi:MAG TPA: L,D-transpeptidase [Dehalococcoidia bacterium]|nr:L,D-transpeptidase [Dehalococcoidia bacterium]
MKRSSLLRIVVPGLLIPLSLALLAFVLPWTRGSDSGDGLTDTTEAQVATPSPLPPDVARDQGDIFRWWIHVATATAPTPTPTPTATPWPSPYDVAAGELPAATAPPGISYGPEERWIAVNVTTQRAYALIGGQVVHVALVTTGMPDFETEIGEYRIGYRKEVEIMDSDTIGIPRDDPLGYYLTDIYWTQYFYPTVALHSNYWQPISVFGHTASSHGCVGMLEGDAKWFWDFAKYGTRVVVYG